MRRFLLIAMLILCCAQIRAQELHVPGEYGTIQSAITAADTNDAVIVAAGTYYENINFLGKAIVVRSADPNDPEVVAATIIDGSKPIDPNIGSAATFVSGENSDSVLSGFTIRNGTGQSDPCGASWYWKGTDGGGVFCRSVSPTITKNVFSNCVAGYGGGAIYCHYQANPTIVGNTFMDNYAGSYGGAIFARLKCSPTISKNIFRENQCRYLGGAVYLADQCYSKVTNNRFERNDCQVLHGGALYYFVSCAPIVACNLFIGNTCSGRDSNGATGAAILMEANTSGKIINNLFTENFCYNSNGVVIKVGSYTTTDLIANNIVYANGDVGIATASGAGPQIFNNNVWQNAGGNYGGNIGDQTGINGNISADPQVGPELPEPFTCYELGPNSPCIDAGDNAGLPAWLTLDYDQTNRLVNGTFDMGPQEYHSIAVPQDFNTIQEAVDNAESGSEIVVSPGFYRENVNFLDKNIRLRSLNPLDANCVAQTVIDGNGLNSCIKILSGQDETAAVAGLWLQNGHGEFGGGVHVGYSIGPVLMYNYITNNSADRYGGGVDYRNYADGKVMNNTIIDNFASDAGGGVHIGPRSSCLIMNNSIINNRTTGEAGGGIYSYDKTTAWIIGNQIIGNKAETANGGGIWQWESGGGVIEGNIIIGNIATEADPPTGVGRGGGIGFLLGATLVTNNIICGNTADEGGGIWLQSGGSCEVVNNTIVGNKANDGGGIAAAYSVFSPVINNIIANNGQGGGIFVRPHSTFPSEPNLVANDVWANAGGNYLGDINDLTGIGGNISADPCFVTAGGWADNNTPDVNDDYWVQGDYRIGYYSACRDGGSLDNAPATDFDGNSRPHFAGIDIGAYELAVFDLTTTGVVGFDDLRFLLNEWLSIGSILPQDLNGDDRVDLQDFALLADGWSAVN